MSERHVPPGLTTDTNNHSPNNLSRRRALAGLVGIGSLAAVSAALGVANGIHNSNKAPNAAETSSASASPSATETPSEPAVSPEEARLDKEQDVAYELVSKLVKEINEMSSEQWATLSATERFEVCLALQELHRLTDELYFIKWKTTKTNEMAKTPNGEIVVTQEPLAGIPKYVVGKGSPGDSPERIYQAIFPVFDMATGQSTREDYTPHTVRCIGSNAFNSSKPGQATNVGHNRADPEGSKLTPQEREARKFFDWITKRAAEKGEYVGYDLKLLKFNKESIDNNPTPYINPDTGEKWVTRVINPVYAPGELGPAGAYGIQLVVALNPEINNWQIIKVATASSEPW